MPARGRGTVPVPERGGGAVPVPAQGRGAVPVRSARCPAGDAPGPGRDYRSRRAARRCGRSWAARPRLRGRGERRGGAGEKGSRAPGLLGESRGRLPARPPRRAAPPRCRRPRRGGRRVPPRCGCPCAAAVARPPPPPERRRSHGAEGGGAAAAGPRLHRGERGEGERTPPAHEWPWRGTGPGGGMLTVPRRCGGCGSGSGGAPARRCRARPGRRAASPVPARPAAAVLRIPGWRASRRGSPGGKMMWQEWEREGGVVFLTGVL